MQSLGQLFKGVTVPQIDYSDPENIEKYLLTLWPTETFNAQLEQAQRMRDSISEGSRDRIRAEQYVERLMALAEQYAARDALAAERPDGCFCLGVGGRVPRYTQAQTKVYSEWCGCPDGLRVQASQEQALADEKRQIEAKRADRLFGKAQVSARFAGYTLASFPVTDEARPSLARLREWLTPPGDEAEESEWDTWVERNKDSLLLHGAYGVGKTGLAVGILRMKLTELGGGLFFTVPTLLDHIRSTYGPNPTADEREVIETVKNTKFLVLDDLGAERVTDWVREKLFTIINHRHDEELPTLFTSNLDVAELAQHIGERTTWRIVEMATVIHIEGPNLRSPKATS